MENQTNYILYQDPGESHNIIEANPEVVVLFPLTKTPRNHSNLLKQLKKVTLILTLTLRSLQRLNRKSRKINLSNANKRQKTILRKSRIRQGLRIHNKLDFVEKTPTKPIVSPPESPAKLLPSSRSKCQAGGVSRI